MSPSWRGLLRKLALAFLGAALLGWLADRLLLALLLTALGCLVWQLWQLRRLDRWLSGDRDAGPPQVGRVWDGIAAHIARLRRQSRKRKRKLSKLLAQFQQATAALPDAAVVLGEDDRVLWCNGAAQQMLGLSPVRDIGLPVVHLLRHPDFVAFLHQRRQGDNVEFSAPVDDALLLSARIVPYGKKQRLLLATDISRVRRLEQVRRDFVANVSHELRTPLTVISGYLETLLDSDSSAFDPWRQPLHRVQEQSRRMLHIVEDLLLLVRLESRKERPPFKPVNAPALLAAIVDDAIALSDEQAHPISVIADPDLWIAGSEKELHSAFANLVFNAVRYTPAGRRIEIRWFADDSGIHLMVEDEGEGIAPHHIPRLTERFYRINRDRSRDSGGTGLGLSIVKHVLNHHGGQLRISSQLGVGSLFTCDFPLDLRLERAAVSARNVTGLR
ncbi:MAG: phosphate regulon sensor histidine kinase PhoR [Candidatus Competibacter sp.]|nr:phosphate regulon sensor histidine kinase PhoR [Candidatus Competibacter sp.]MDG4605634.1 phosphate regulon sensor histidine kinase PhoR [Candidatus Contendobacter sp.]HRD50692.1 phosphate regulon sensor histidine kinase PhoR [Candidatus Contendobacter sp.]